MEKEEYEITTKLIDEAYKNVRMASFAIDCLIENIENKSFEDLLRKQNQYYLESTKSIESLSKTIKHKTIDINPFLKGMSFTSIKVKTLMNNESSHLAQMLVEGTTMGITQLIKAKSDYPSKNNKLIGIVQKIIEYEEEFVDSLKKYL